MLSHAGLARASTWKPLASRNASQRTPCAMMKRGLVVSLTAHIPTSASGGGGKRPRHPPICATGGRDGPGDEPAKPSSGLWGKYLELLESHPLLARAATCGVLNGLGDILAQLLVEKTKPNQLNTQRVLTFIAMGFFLTGPAITVWYNALSKLFPVGNLRSIVSALLVDQLVFAPCCIAVFLAIITALEGKPEAVRHKLECDLWPAVKVNWLIWVPAQAVNFTFVPLALRAPFVNMVALIWNVFLSYQSYKPAVATA